MTKIGLLSDTHGHVERTRRAAEELGKHAPDVLVHCGDIGSDDVLYALAECFDLSQTPLTAVYGNVDSYAPGLREFPRWDGLTLREQQAVLDIDDFKALVIHGHDLRRLQQAVTSGTYDAVFTGHTHVASDRMEGSTRVINPGAVYRSPEPSVALLTLPNQLDFIPVSR